jgi:hypothetical protein
MPEIHDAGDGSPLLLFGHRAGQPVYEFTDSRLCSEYLKTRATMCFSKNGKVLICWVISVDFNSFQFLTFINNRHRVHCW